MEIKISDEQVNIALQATILETIGAQGRELIIKQAVEHLMRPNDYGNKRTPIQDILYSAVDKITALVFKDKLENDPIFIAQVESLYADAIKQVMGTETRQKTVDKIASAIQKALSDRY